MPRDVKRLETALCDDADATLGQLEVRKVALHGMRSDGTEILTVHDGAGVGDRPYPSRCDPELLTVGQIAGQLDPADTQQRSDDGADRGEHFCGFATTARASAIR